MVKYNIMHVEHPLLDWRTSPLGLLFFLVQYGLAYRFMRKRGATNIGAIVGTVLVSAPLNTIESPRGLVLHLKRVVQKFLRRKIDIEYFKKQREEKRQRRQQ